jgi:hypothetical protein
MAGGWRWRYRSTDGSPRLSDACPIREPLPGASLSTVDRQSPNGPMRRKVIVGHERTQQPRTLV